MCRAFVGIKLGEEPEYDAHLRSIMLHYMKNSHTVGNKEGYFFSSIDLEGNHQSVRTLDFVNVMKAFQDLPTNNVVHGHARKASRGDTTEEFVHGWEFNGWTCSMNGTMSFNDDFDMPKDGNDSLHFFEMCFNEEHNVYSTDIQQWFTNIKKLAENAISHGNGALFFTNPEYTIVLNFNKTLTIHLLNRRLMVMNSNDDIHKSMDKDVEIVVSEKETEEAVTKGLVDFSTKHKEQDLIVFDAVVPRMEDLKIELKDSIILIEHSTGDIIRKEDGLDFPYNQHAATYRQNSHNRGTPYTGTRTPTTASPTPKGKGSGKEWNSLDDLSGKYLNFKEEVERAFEVEDAEEAEALTDEVTEEERRILEELDDAFPDMQSQEAKKAYAAHLINEFI